MPIPTFASSNSAKNELRFNVSGSHYVLSEKILSQLPNSLLGSATLRNKYFDFKRNEYFLDRHKATFEAVIGKASTK